MAGFKLQVPACLVGVASMSAQFVNLTCWSAPPHVHPPRGPGSDPVLGGQCSGVCVPSGDVCPRVTREVSIPEREAPGLLLLLRPGLGQLGPRRRDRNARDTCPPVWAPSVPLLLREPRLEACPGSSARVPCPQRAKVEPLPAGGDGARPPRGCAGPRPSGPLRAPARSAAAVGRGRNYAFSPRARPQTQF